MQQITTTGVPLGTMPVNNRVTLAVAYGERSDLVPGWMRLAPMPAAPLLKALEGDLPRRQATPKS